MTELKKSDTVRELVDLFNTGKIRYQDIQDLFNVSRDLIKARLAGIGLRWDNSQKKLAGEATEGDLNTPLLQLFEKQRGRNQYSQSPKVITDEPTNVGTKERTNRTNQPSNVLVKRAKEQIEQANEQTAPTKEPIAPTKERSNDSSNVTTNVIRKRSSFDIDVELMKDLKIQAIIHDRNVYEIVENAIRKELAELKKGR